MAELVDAPDSKFGGVTPRVGSSPTLGTKNHDQFIVILL